MALKTLTELFVIERPAWQEFGLCASDPDDSKWFAKDKVKESTLTKNCDGCPVRRDCLEEALTLKPYGEQGDDQIADHGVWGGTTTKERAAIREGFDHPVRHEPFADVEALAKARGAKQGRHVMVVAR